jgi:hypothetical protein
MSLRAKKLIVWSTVAAALAAVFALYTQPQMMVRLSDLLWACFN